MKKRFLESIKNPQDLKKMNLHELEDFSIEIRDFLVDQIPKTGGHLASNLGVVELTLAIHKVFNCPKDKIIFDVGHQSYVHKILTGRNSHFPTVRQTNGLSGFTHPRESIHDLFYSGHAGNALSLALGLAKNRDIGNQNETIIPIIGDAAFTCGLTFEALNNIPCSLKKFIIILNDNRMSISKNIGAITKILNRYAHQTNPINRPHKSSKIDSKLCNYDSNPEEDLSSLSFFEQFGLNYIGPIDGHDIENMINTN